MDTLTIADGPFELPGNLYDSSRCPEWFRDAKARHMVALGVRRAVPAFGDWYAMHMYEEGSDQLPYHLRKFGHPSVFGYKDVVKLWKAEKFRA